MFFFFPDLVTGSGSANPVNTARGLSATQQEAGTRSLATQKPKRRPRVVYIGGLVQERRNSIANALELRLSCTNPSICDTLSQFPKIWLFIVERVWCVGLVAIAPTWVRNNNMVGVSFVFFSSNGNIFRVTWPSAGNSPVTGEFPAQRPVTRSFDVFSDLRLNELLSKQSWGWWFDRPSHPLWRHSNNNWTAA